MFSKGKDEKKMSREMKVLARIISASTMREGISSGELYAEVMDQGCSLEEYQEVIHQLEELRLIQIKGYWIMATELLLKVFGLKEATNEKV